MPTDWEGLPSAILEGYLMGKKLQLQQRTEERGTKKFELDIAELEQTRRERPIQWKIKMGESFDQPVTITPEEYKIVAGEDITTPLTIPSPTEREAAKKIKLSKVDLDIWKQQQQATFELTRQQRQEMLKQAGEGGFNLSSNDKIRFLLTGDLPKEKTVIDQLKDAMASVYAPQIAQGTAPPHVMKMMGAYIEPKESLQEFEAKEKIKAKYAPSAKASPATLIADIRGQYNMERRNIDMKYGMIDQFGRFLIPPEKRGMYLQDLRSLNSRYAKAHQQASRGEVPESLVEVPVLTPLNDIKQQIKFAGSKERALQYIRSPELKSYAEVEGIRLEQLEAEVERAYPVRKQSILGVPPTHPAKSVVKKRPGIFQLPPAEFENILQRPD